MCLDGMNILSGWLTQKYKNVVDKTRNVSIIDIEHNDDGGTLTKFSDGNIVHTKRDRLQCSCGSSSTIRKTCRHAAKLCHKLHIAPKEASHKIYSRLLCVISKPCCAICLEPLYDSKEKGKAKDTKEIKYDKVSSSSSCRAVPLAQIHLAKMWMCEQCGIAMHTHCCKSWQGSTLGRSWDKTCFVCSYSLVEI